MLYRRGFGRPKKMVIGMVIGWAAVGYYEQGSCKFLDVKELDL